MCTFIKCTLKVHEPKPYDRKVLYTPFTRYESTLQSKTVIIPKHHKSIEVEIPALNITSKKQTAKSSTFNSGRTIGTVANISHTIQFPARNKNTSASDITREEFIGKFHKTWPVEISSQVEDLLWHHHNVFAMDHTSLGKCDVTEHDIELSDTTPIRQKYRRIPPTMYESVKIEIEKLLEAGVIKPSCRSMAEPYLYCSKERWNSTSVFRLPSDQFINEKGCQIHPTDR